MAGLFTFVELLDEHFKNLLKTFSFYTLKIGPECNARYRNRFTDAVCDIHVVKVHKRDQMEPAGISFVKLFKSGFELLDNVKKGTNPESFGDEKMTALMTLENFFKEKDKHEESMKKLIFQVKEEKTGIIEKKHEKISEADISVALAEHFLSRLSPGQSYQIDASSEFKDALCKCGCKADVKFGKTGLGHETVWYGFTDIILTSTKNIPESAAITIIPDMDASRPSTSTADADDTYETPNKKVKITDLLSDERKKSPGGSCISEVKDSRAGTENQCVAQAIVFALIQKNRHPELKNFLIPTIAISPTCFHVILYDAERDILMWSNARPVLHKELEDQPEHYLVMNSVVILWMVLHYKIFCNGVPKSLRLKDSDIKSDFPERAGDKWELYTSSLKLGEAYFPEIPKTSFPKELSYSLYDIEGKEESSEEMNA